MEVKQRAPLKRFFGDIAAGTVFTTPESSDYEGGYNRYWLRLAECSQAAQLRTGIVDDFKPDDEVITFDAVVEVW